MNSELVITLVPWDTKGKNLEKQVSLVIKTKLLCLGELLTSNQNEEASKNGVALGSLSLLVSLLTQKPEQSCEIQKTSWLSFTRNLPGDF